MTNLIGQNAPSIKAPAVYQGKIIPDFSLEQFKGKYVVLFFYPLDFTFVCPTELHGFEERYADFKGRGAEVIGCSVDSAHCHLAWLRTPKAQGGIEGISYPLIADIKKEVSSSFNVLSSDGVAYRGLFLIDKSGKIRHYLVNDLALGRSVDEALRTLDALITFETDGEVCPANWKKGEKAMAPTREGVNTYFALKS
jgi:peroxiredoxin (alkyl hydroperoxide reductase subunit C)